MTSVIAAIARWKKDQMNDECCRETGDHENKDKKEMQAVYVLDFVVWLDEQLVGHVKIYVSFESKDMYM